MRTALRRLIGGVAVACVLAIPMALAAVLDALGSHGAEKASVVVILVVLFSTALLALPWILALAPLGYSSPDSPALVAVLLMVGWAFNAFIALRGWTLTRLMLIAGGLAVIQSVLVVAWSR